MKDRLLCECRDAGPVGLLAVMWAKYRGAARIFSIDCIEERLAKAQSKGAETINFSKVNVIDTMQKLLPDKIDVMYDRCEIFFIMYRWSYDVFIDAVGFRYTKDKSSL